MADIKFSEFPKATTSKDSDEIAILQDGVNKMIQSPVLESKIINKTVTRVIEQGGASLNVVDLKGVVPTYADLALITPTPEINDAYQVEADGLVYVYTENGFQADGEGFNLIPEPTGVVEDGNPLAVSGGEVFSKTVNPEDIGIININIGDNIISEYTPDKLEDDTIWTRGYFKKTDGEIVDVAESANLYRSKNLIKVNKLSSYSYSFKLRGNAGVCFFDKDLNFIKSISTEESTVQTVNGVEIIDEDIEYMGISFAGSTSSLSSGEFISNNNYSEITASVFIKNDETGNSIIRDIVDNEINLDYQERGVNDIPVDTNFINELTGSDINDIDLWGVGLFREDGTVLGLSDWRYSRHYYELKKGNKILHQVRLN